MAHVLTEAGERSQAQGPRVLVLDGDAQTTANVIAAVDALVSVAVFADVEAMLEDLDQSPDGVIVLTWAASQPDEPASEMLRRVRARRPHVPVVVVSGSQSPHALRALGAHAVVGRDAPAGELQRALNGALAFG